jgi:hypothetical protein
VLIIIRPGTYCKSLCKKFTIFEGDAPEKSKGSGRFYHFSTEYSGQIRGRIGTDRKKGGWKNFNGGLGGYHGFFGKVSVAFTYP